MSTMDHMGPMLGQQDAGTGAPPPADLAAILGQPQQDQGAPGSDALGALQDAIHATAAAMTALPDAADTHDVGKALVLLAGVQKRLMQGSGGPQAG